MQERSIWKISGRDSRREFAIIQAVVLAGTLFASVCAYIVDRLPVNKQLPSAGLMLLGVLMLAWIHFSSAARRAHDLNKSSWCSLLMVVPVVNLAALVLFLFARGSNQENQYGPAPDARFTAARDQAWEAAYKELTSPQREDALWARTLAMTRGDRKKAEALYLDQRFKNLFAAATAGKSLKRVTLGWAEFFASSGALVSLLIATLSFALTGPRPVNGATAAATCASPSTDRSSRELCGVRVAHPDVDAIVGSARFVRYISRTPGAAQILSKGSDAEFARLIDDYKKAANAEDLARWATGQDPVDVRR